VRSAPTGMRGSAGTPAASGAMAVPAGAGDASAEAGFEAAGAAADRTDRRYVAAGKRRSAASAAHAAA